MCNVDRIAFVSVELHLSDEVVARLEAEAVARRSTIEDVVSDMARRLPAPGTVRTRRRLAFAAIGESTGDKFAGDADQLLAEGFGRS